ncbi:MAG: hypothetical protein HKUEN02_22730 [Anaerolineaceae bacterium]|nr:MAG: hypothetical protein HKUEN02_22730 [Anaerolineaceae bacterium]
MDEPQNPWSHINRTYRRFLVAKIMFCVTFIPNLGRALSASVYLLKL